MLYSVGMWSLDDGGTTMKESDKVTDAGMSGGILFGESRSNGGRAKPAGNTETARHRRRR